MKQYPKKYEDLYRDKEEIKLERIQAFSGSTANLVASLQDLLTTSYDELFRIAISYLWLEKQISYNGERRLRRWRNGHIPDQIFKRFMTVEIGKDSGLLTRNGWFHVSSHFIAEYFPDFLDHDLFEEKEYFKYPYKYATLDFFKFIYQVHCKREMMDYAEEQQMTYHDFTNWVTNYVLSYNDEQGEEIYSIGKARDSDLFIRSINWEKHPLDILYETTKATEADSDERNEV